MGVVFIQENGMVENWDDEMTKQDALRLQSARSGHRALPFSKV
jgi:hypothetical protein